MRDYESLTNLGTYLNTIVAKHVDAQLHFLEGCQSGSRSKRAAAVEEDEGKKGVKKPRKD